MESRPGKTISKVLVLLSLLGASLFLANNLFALPDGPGKDLYMYYCAQCHGEKANGKGPNATEDLPTEPKDFLDVKNLPVFSDKQIINTITEGGPAEQLSHVMPSWGNILTEGEIETLRGFLRQVCKCQYDPVAAEKAKAEKEKEKASKPKSKKDDDE